MERTIRAEAGAGRRCKSRTGTGDGSLTELSEDFRQLCLGKFGRGASGDDAAGCTAMAG